MKILGIPFNNSHEPGFHALFDIYFRDFPDDLYNLNTMQEKFERAVKIAHLNVVKHDSYVFGEYGLTGFYILTESHLAFHTWPENKYIAIDLFTCGIREKTTLAIETIKQEFMEYDPQRIRVRIVRRGFVYDGKINRRSL